MLALYGHIYARHLTTSVLGCTYALLINTLSIKLIATQEILDFNDRIGIIWGEYDMTAVFYRQAVKYERVTSVLWFDTRSDAQPLGT